MKSISNTALKPSNQRQQLSREQSLQRALRPASDCAGPGGGGRGRPAILGGVAETALAVSAGVGAVGLLFGEDGVAEGEVVGLVFEVVG